LVCKPIAILLCFQYLKFGILAEFLISTIKDLGQKYSTNRKEGLHKRQKKKCDFGVSKKIIEHVPT